MFFLKAKFSQNQVKKPNSLRKYLKLQKIHGFFLHLIDFDEEYLFQVLQYLHHDDGGDHDCGRDDDVRGHRSEEHTSELQSQR